MIKKFFKKLFILGSYFLEMIQDILNITVYKQLIIYINYLYYYTNNCFCFLALFMFI